METNTILTNLSWMKIWNKSIPSKVSCLVWRLLQNKIATKDNLFRRGVIGQGSLMCCSGCGTEESVFHLFFECPIFAGIWYDVSKWMGISTALHKEGMNHLEQFEGLIGSGRAFTERVRVIWFACIWCIWRSRNEKLFKNKEINLINMVEYVKRWSWNWLKVKSSSIDYNFILWYLNPRACLGCVDY
ncbi:unnamed protein product [Trifolium pratense]|uniref:Uncharacterized protein n=1 Tax=Trifolium pratense TaxID=57577 RepID=A0ACB0IAM5_TRIPR|nr:unnamed protein product [Trifolium pratense]